MTVEQLNVIVSANKADFDKKFDDMDAEVAELFEG